jgi:flagellar biosynthesis protein FlhA
LLTRVAGIRRQLATQAGYLMPPVKVKDNMALRSHEYVIQMRGIEIARFQLRQGYELAIPSGAPDPNLQGIPTADPAFGLPAVWIRQDQVDRARSSGYTVVDGVSVIGTHLTEVVRRHAHELFTRQDAKAFCDRVALENPKAVEDLVPKLLPLATIQRVLQNMLRERVPIRDGVGILEALGEAAQTTKNPVLLTDYVRQSLRRAIVKQLVNPQGELSAYLLDPSIERAIESSVEHGEMNSILGMAPDGIRDILSRLSRKIAKAESAVILTSAGARYFLRQILEPTMPAVAVISHGELPAEMMLKSRGVIE